MAETTPHKELLIRVTRRIDQTNATTDHLLLLRWQVLGLCQYLLASPGKRITAVIENALEIFARVGASSEADQALKAAVEHVANESSDISQHILPSIAFSKRKAVLDLLADFEELGPDAITKAADILPALRDRLRKTPSGTLLAGLRHRLNLVASIAADPNQAEQARARAAASILYLDEQRDVIPDSLGLIDLLDDDFALRVVLEEFGNEPAERYSHWAEIITTLWDDLPFMRGIQLHNSKGPVATTWVDRLNSYVSYTHALDRGTEAMILLQPSIACSPVHAIVTLIGLLIFDGLTSSEDLIKSLVKGRVYEIDGKCFARYLGISEAPVPGWLILEIRDGRILRPPTIADRMVAVQERQLSTGKMFSTNVQPDDAEPIEKFFDWDEAIGAASLANRVLFVTSRQRATDLFGDVNSNGISLLDDGLVRFSGLTPDPDVLRGGLVIVVPNLTVARRLIDYEIGVQAIVIDGYERLRRGRHDLPFLSSANSAPPVIVWSPNGYFPNETPAWLPNCRRLEISQDDLSFILELDGEIDHEMAPSRASLWEAATHVGVDIIPATFTPEEIAVLEAVKEFQHQVRNSAEMPEYWQYHFFATANTLRLLVGATPSSWSDVLAFAESWRTTFDEQWSTLRTRAAKALEPVRQRHLSIFDSLSRIRAERNSKADALITFNGTLENSEWKIVCDRLEQVNAASNLLESIQDPQCSPLLQKDLPACSNCIVVGWPNRMFSQRIWAHTPTRLVAIASEHEGKLWAAAVEQSKKSHGDSILRAIGFERRSPLRQRTSDSRGDSTSVPIEQVEVWLGRGAVEETLVPCVFVWLVDEANGKVLARSDRVLTADGDRAREKFARSLESDDSVILGPGHARWSPADEFTQAVLRAIETSHPDLVVAAREWRRALSKLVDGNEWSVEDLQSALLNVGVSRGPQTLANWLDLDNASPIGPMYIHKEISAMWGLVFNTYSDRSAEEVSLACTQLRSLRSAAGRSLLRLWEGRSVDLGVDHSILADLVERIREHVMVHDVESVTHGEVPESMIGWWVSHDLAETFDVTGRQANDDDGLDEKTIGEDDFEIDT